MTDQTQPEKRAAADAAKSKATEARTAADAATDDAALQTAATEAEAEAARLEKEATAPLHDQRSERPKSEKIKKRMQILQGDLRAALINEGKDPDEMSDDELAREERAHAENVDDDDSKPLTRGEAKKFGIIKTAESMANELQNTELRAAVVEELRFISKDIPAEQRYQKALSLASSSKNSKVAQEAIRAGNRNPQRHGSGGGAPARTDEEFTPTPLERQYMTKFKMTKEEIIASRNDARKANFGANDEE